MSGAWGHSFLVVSTPPPFETDLVTLDELKLELGITGTTEDAALSARITRLSEQIAEYCDRIFALLDVEETFAFNGSRSWYWLAPAVMAFVRAADRSRSRWC